MKTKDCAGRTFLARSDLWKTRTGSKGLLRPRNTDLGTLVLGVQVKGTATMPSMVTHASNPRILEAEAVKILASSRTPWDTGKQKEQLQTLKEKVPR